MRYILCALFCLLASPAFANGGGCITEDVFHSMMQKQWPGIEKHARFDGTFAERFIEYLRLTYDAPVEGDAMVQYGFQNSQRVSVAFFNEGCFVYDSFVGRDRFNNDVKNVGELGVHNDGEAGST